MQLLPRARQEDNHKVEIEEDYYDPCTIELARRNRLFKGYTRTRYRKHMQVWYPKTTLGEVANHKHGDVCGLGYEVVMMVQASPIKGTNIPLGRFKEVSESKDDLFKVVTPDTIPLAPREMEEGGQAMVDELCEINLGTEETPKPIFISALLSLVEREEYTEVLR